MRLRIVVALVVVAATLIALLFLVLRPSESAQRSKLATAPASLIVPRQRRILPNLSGSALDPPPRKLLLRTPSARPELIDVWASWCIPCKQEAPTLAALERTYGRRVRFLGVNVEDTRADARAFERRYRIRYPSVYDEPASMATKLRVIGLPTVLLVDGRGRIAALLIGKQTAATLHAKVRRLAAEAN